VSAPLTVAEARAIIARPAPGQPKLAPVHARMTVAQARAIIARPALTAGHLASLHRIDARNRQLTRR
jgi:hypothetical protein